MRRSPHKARKIPRLLIAIHTPLVPSIRGVKRTHPAKAALCAREGAAKSAVHMADTSASISFKKRRNLMTACCHVLLVSTGIVIEHSNG